MSINISRKRKEQLVDKIEEIRQYILTNAPNGELEGWLGEISAELKSHKYGLVFEEHMEKIDEMLLKNIPVFNEQKELQIDCNGEFNFLLEGDNLPALKLLNKTHKQNIDFIYIDPPYNTKSKDFMYDDSFVDPNDVFKHSKWLSFMEKRIVEAHRLLKDSGCIMISINEEEVFELKMLCDKIFGDSNYLAMFSVKVRHQDRILKGDKDFHEIMEYMLMYRKSPKFKTIKRLVDNTSNKDYVYQIVEKIDNPEITVMDGKNVSIFKPNEYEIVKVEASIDNLKKINIRGSIKEGNSSGRVFMKHLNKFIGKNLGYLYKVPDMGDDKFGYRYFLIPSNGKRTNGDYFQGVPLNRNDIKEVPYANYIEANVLEDEHVFESELNYLDFETAFNNVGYEGYVEFRNGKKPLDFLDKCFEMSGVKKNKNAIVLDFFAGSGSTGHALMRLNNQDGGNRKFIIITNSQNNICREITYERMKKVIENDKYNEGLKYYKVDFINKENRVYYEYANELLKHVKELIQIENNIDLDKNNKYKIILTDEEFEEIVSSSDIPKKIYLGLDVLVDNSMIDNLKNRGTEVVLIPNHYYSDIN